ncbi:GumC family protein [Roseibium sp.]|uniref:GumC family protein n=1 Tax=Roseibium sp. TaxID=1936156 RepID=UPI003B514445
MEQSFNLSAILSVARRRYMSFVLPAIVIFAAAVGVAYYLPPTYESKSVILIESQRIPTQLASTTVNADASERLKVIEQRLLTRSNLLSIANEYDLYSNNVPKLSPTEIVQEMRDSISIEQIAVSRERSNKQIVGFEISFQYTSARTASRVANDLVSSILSQNLETRLNRAAETSEFFQQQLRNLENELLATEERIAAYKRDNEAALPDTLGMRREKLSELTAQLELVSQQVTLYESESNGVASLGNPNEQQLAFQLQAQELNYNAFVERRELLTPLLEKGFVSQRTIDDLDRSIAQAELEIASTKSQMAQEGFAADPATRLDLLKTQKMNLERRTEELQQSIARTPSVEVELSALLRSYDLLRDEFSQTKIKLTNAEIGERLEQDRQAERFEVLEQATIPEKPKSPDRVMIAAAGGGGAMAVGLGLVVLLEFLDKSIRTAGDLERRLKLRPIAVIPYVSTRRERIKKNLRRLLTLCVALIAILAALAIAHLYFTPLDQFADRVWFKIEPYLQGIEALRR